MAKGMVIAIVALAVLVIGAVFVFMQSGSEEETGIPQTGEQQQQTETQPEPQPSVKEFSIEADDSGFYIDGADIGSISAGSGETLKITFNVRTTNVYYAGLDFRGCGKTTEKVSPGGSTLVEFTAASTCTITSYWPSSGVVKDRLQVVVG
ncbi:MAG: hypothetical protein Q8P79_00030 [Nanoarchaeota archaeon]|nr:hypothetical protein [Nanoarchaeota archaeon]